MSQFRQYLLDEMKKRDMSARQMAEFIGVAPTTITRAIDERDPTTPGLDFILKVSSATKISVTALIEMAYPDAVSSSKLSPQAQILAQQIDALPDDQKQVILAIIRGTNLG